MSQETTLADVLRAQSEVNATTLRSVETLSATNEALASAQEQIVAQLEAQRLMLVEQNRMFGLTANALNATIASIDDLARQVNERLLALSKT